MTDVIYKSRVWQTDVLLREAREMVDVMIAALLPINYKLTVEKCDDEVPGFPHSPRYTYRASIQTVVTDWKDGGAKFTVHGHSEGEAKAKILGLFFSGCPQLPLK